MEKLSTESFARLRIGVGHNFRGASQGAEYVLGAFEGEEKVLFEKVASAAAEAVEVILRRGIVFGMNQYNKLDLTPAVEEDAGQEAAEK
jgi:PTH1 family peptidyl-tRNA hydrolase